VFDISKCFHKEYRAVTILVVNVPLNTLYFILGLLGLSFLIVLTALSRRRERFRLDVIVRPNPIIKLGLSDRGPERPPLGRIKVRCAIGDVHIIDAKETRDWSFLYRVIDKPHVLRAAERLLREQFLQLIPELRHLPFKLPIDVSDFALGFLQPRRRHRAYDIVLDGSARRK